MTDDMMKENIVVVTSPDDKVEAFTKVRKKTPAVRFVYHPMANNVHAPYLEDLRKCGESLTRLQEVNYKMLAEHVVDGDLYNSKREKLDFSNVDAWRKVLSSIILDIASTVAGLDDETAEEEEKELGNL